MVVGVVVVVGEPVLLQVREGVRMIRLSLGGGFEELLHLNAGDLREHVRRVVGVVVLEGRGLQAVHLRL